MTRKEMKQLRYLHKEIALYERDIAMLIARNDASEFSGEILKLASDMKKMKRSAARKQRRLLRFISDIDDSDLRQIFIMYYIDGLTWQQIALKLGAIGDGSTERKKHNAYLSLSSAKKKI